MQIFHQANQRPSSFLQIRLETSWGYVAHHCNVYLKHNEAAVCTEDYCSVPLPVGNCRLWCRSQSQWDNWNIRKWQANYPWERAEHFRRVFKKSFFLHWYDASDIRYQFLYIKSKLDRVFVYTHWVELSTYTIYGFSSCSDSCASSRCLTKIN